MMHELAITKSLIESIKLECKKHDIKIPKRIVLELGMLTNYVGDSIKFYYDSMKKKELLLKDTELIIQEVDGKVECHDCRKEGDVKDCCLIMCPVCDSMNVDVIAGKEIIIKKIER